jgi:hypothetical protein
MFQCVCHVWTEQNFDSDEPPKVVEVNHHQTLKAPDLV